MLTPSGSDTLRLQMEVGSKVGSRLQDKSSTGATVWSLAPVTSRRFPQARRSRANALARRSLREARGVATSPDLWRVVFPVVPLSALLVGSAIQPLPQSSTRACSAYSRGSWGLVLGCRTRIQNGQPKGRQAFSDRLFPNCKRSFTASIC